jgi:hypothetical protein
MPSAASNRRYLLDTNAYLHLADSFHPLIARSFGDPPCLLRVAPAVDGEIRKNPRLIKKFPWALSPKFQDDRKHYLRPTPAEREAIIFLIEYVENTAEEMGKGLSPIDIFCLAYARKLGLVVVTDDVPMRDVADALGISAIATLDLLKVFLDEGRATLKEIEDVVYMMEYRNDVPDPGTFWRKYLEYFGAKGEYERQGPISF